VAAVSRSFDFTIESPATVEQLHSAFSNREYWLARYGDSGGVARLDSLDIDAAGSVSVTIVGDGQREHMKGPIAKLYPRSWQTVQQESWTPIGDGQVRGEIDIATRGAPGSGRGTALLSPMQQGSRVKFTGTVQFNVPLIGGKIEALIARQLREQISELLRFTAEWITERD
jgi:hypothetical protein